MSRLLSMKKLDDGKIKCATEFGGYVIKNTQTPSQKNPPKYYLSPDDKYLFSLNLMPGDVIVAEVRLALAVYYNPEGAPVFAKFDIDDLVYDEQGVRKTIIRLKTPLGKDFWEDFIQNWIEVIMDQCDVRYVPCVPTFKQYETWTDLEAPEFHWTEGQWTRIKDE